MVASWRAGTGGVVCYTGEADGKYAGPMAKWEQAGDYFTSLARWTAGATGPLRDNMLLTQEVREGVNLVQLHLDPERKGDPFAGLPKVSDAAQPAGAGAADGGGADALDGGGHAGDRGAARRRRDDADDGGRCRARAGEPVAGVPAVLAGVPADAARPRRGDAGAAGPGDRRQGARRTGRASGRTCRDRCGRSRWHVAVLLAVLCVLLEVFERRTLMLSGLLRPRKKAVSEPVRAR